MFEISRNHFFIFGLLVLLFGVQFRFVETYVLNADAGQAISKMKESTGLSSSGSLAPAASSRVLHPPEWLGWAAISIGAVLVMHALAMSPAE